MKVDWDRDLMILHVAVLDKFIPPFVDFVEANFEDFSNRHVFFIQGEDSKYPIRPRKNILFASSRSGLDKYRMLLSLMYRADKVILHGLWDNRLVLLLAMQPWLLKKCYWVIWGGDLYVHQLVQKTAGWRFNEFLRRVVIRRMGHLTTYIKGDVDLARKWYGARGQYHECLMYTSNVFNGYALPPKEGETMNILVGNSADPSNEHMEVFDALEAYKDEDIKIYVPLSYGDKNYALKVVERGKKAFGDKFIPMLDFMQFNDYLKLLAQIDVAVFNHKRQQAMGNAITLLGLGKKVYIRNDVVQWAFFKRIGVVVFDVLDIGMERISEVDKSKNIGTVKNYFSHCLLRGQWAKIFDGPM